MEGSDRQPPWLARAWHELGQREQSGSASNPRISALFRDAGHPMVTSDETAWCAALVGACLARSGIAGTGSLRARSYLDWGKAADGLRPGAVAVLSRGADPAAGHVGFLVGWVDGGIVLLGGNQGDEVSVERFPRDRLLGLRWPMTSAEAGAATATVSAREAGDSGRFDRALAHVLEMEGGFTDDPHDPGGPTNRGITLAVYAAWRRVTLDATNHAALKDELMRIPDETVREIYRRRYWEPARCPVLPAGVEMMHFDAAVNQGVGAAARMLQEAAGADLDGEIGPLTLAAVDAAGRTELLQRYADLRRERYRRLPHFTRFGRGWLRRVDIALARARADAGDRAEITTARGETSMQIETPAGIEPKWWGKSMTVWGAIVSAMATVVPALGPLIGVDISSEIIRHAGGQAAIVLQALAGLVGTLLTIRGRLRATQPLGQRDISFRL